MVKVPLPSDVGEAIAGCVQHDRPHCSTRRLFVTQRAPITGLSTGRGIVKAVTRGLKRADIRSERKGGYLFRHTLATEMLGRGASLGPFGGLSLTFGAAPLSTEIRPSSTRCRFPQIYNYPTRQPLTSKIKRTKNVFARPYATFCSA